MEPIKEELSEKEEYDVESFVDMDGEEVVAEYKASIDVDGMHNNSVRSTEYDFSYKHKKNDVAGIWKIKDLKTKEIFTSETILNIDRTSLKESLLKIQKSFFNTNDMLFHLFDVSSELAKAVVPYIDMKNEITDEVVERFISNVHTEMLLREEYESKKKGE